MAECTSVAELRTWRTSSRRRSRGGERQNTVAAKCEVVGDDDEVIEAEGM